MKDIFAHPTISSLSLYVTKHKSIADQGIVEGKVQFTPIQQLLFERTIYPSHYNQSILLKSKERLERSLLEKSLQYLQEHHDARRMVYRQKESKVTQYNRGTDHAHQGLS